MSSENRFYATGKRKNGIARTWIFPGSGNITVNNKPFDEYFSNSAAKFIVQQPLDITDTAASYDVMVRVRGGGIVGQAGAVRHGISKALIQADPELRNVLKKAGFITRDSRVKERKKYGQKGARARFQFSKR